MPPDKAFKGFSDDIVIIVASALVVSAAVARSGVIERVVRMAWRPICARPSTQVDRRSVGVGDACCRRFVKNIGALAMLMPVAFQIARRTGTSPSVAADADVVRRAARRHRHAGRHLAEHHRLPRARAR